MDIPTKIKLSETYAKMSEAELARKLGTTSQSFEQRMKTGKFSYTDLCTIADALGAEIVCCFKFPRRDGNIMISFLTRTLTSKHSLT